MTIKITDNRKPKPPIKFCDLTFYEMFLTNGCLCLKLHSTGAFSFENKSIWTPAPNLPIQPVEISISIDKDAE